MGWPFDKLKARWPFTRRSRRQPAFAKASASAKASGFAKATPDKPADRSEGTDAPHQWFWDGHGHVDPLKEANAQAKRLETGATTLAIEYARIGLDWEEQLRQRAKEVALMEELGLSAVQAALPAPSDRDESERDEEEENRSAA